MSIINAAAEVIYDTARGEYVDLLVAKTIAKELYMEALLTDTTEREVQQ